MMTAQVNLLAVIFVCALLPPATAPSTLPTPDQLFMQLKAAAEAEARELLTGLPDLGTKRTDELFDLHLEQGNFEVLPRLPRTEPSRVDLSHWKGPATICVQSDRVDQSQILTVQLNHKDFSRPGEVCRITTLFAQRGRLQIAQTIDAPLESSNVDYIQGADENDQQRATLYVQISSEVTGQQRVNLKLSAPSFAELKRNHPLDVQQYVGSILLDLGCSPALLAADPRDAFTAFPETAHTDVALEKQVNDTLAMFDSEDFQTRERAAGALEKLGQPAAAVLLKIDRTGWSIDRSAGVDTFLAKFQSEGDRDGEKLRNDPAFLLDCLMLDDAAMRNAAIAQLLRRPEKLSIELPDDPVERARLVLRLYPKLVQPTPGSDRSGSRD